MKDFFVKDMSLAAQGKMNLEYAESQMGALAQVKKRFERELPLKGIRVGMALHVTKETGILVRTLIAGGAEVAITGCNPLSTQDDVAAALADEGVAVFAYKGETKEDYYKFLNAVLDFSPQATIDDGADLITEIHTKRPELLKQLIVGTEETTTGIIRLRAMEKDNALKYPIMAVNDNKTKHLFDNYYGTGQSTLDGILRATNVLFAGKTVVVAGYGDCGKGVALRSKGMGADVIVTEVDPVCALQAYADGFMVRPMAQAAPLGDIFITVTGDKDVLVWDHMKLMKTGAILANSGHFNVEIDTVALEKNAKSKRRVRWQLDEYVLPNNRKIFLVGEGRLVNLASAEGHPSEVMDLSFCGQALALEYGIKNKGKLKAGVHVLSPEVDASIAQLKLDSLGIKMDELTAAQKDYLASWKEGT
ncbi:MAG: adenosylhomocysteinase [Candidatus Diapherotrites archaeon]|nr:adenosylhomocysteinase [Candidatus Diapherotrites archaeon]